MGRMTHIDLYAGIAAFAYALAAFILKQQGVADLSEFVATPEAAGTFALVAFGRFYKEHQSAASVAVKE